MKKKFSVTEEVFVIIVGSQKWAADTGMTVGPGKDSRYFVF